MAPVFVLLAPIVGALCSNLVPGTAVPLGFWRGLVVQCALIAAPLAATWWGPVRWRNLLFQRAGARASLGLCIAYSAVYLLLLFAAQRAGLHVSHFDLARRTLGLPVVLALYVPLWGFLEALWMAYVYAYLDLGALRRPHPSWLGLALGGAWFGALHAAVQVVAYHVPWGRAWPNVAIGILFCITQSITKWSRNAWGAALFWTVSNF
ncbi:hypothetical protein [Alicyclobacillus acidocaldarius]|uniref:Uncharacterized protein n=1 Tax=Alicyclobacillus acidocaldarius (strain Tc-4-1) TaxID=1048834 RepID=F8IIE7_ALIAT|nr:hypothetical protein [Alicyclobacillus acidocaldarius]AEJ42106.1 hypothetical protein TC41_0128 [Alicyclobacillus acidocaldarius subsp. acidocaldarius Tc-4-1]